MAVRIGVVGTGFGTQVHIPAFQSEGLEVVAICSRREERAREAAEKFGVAHAFTDYDEMLQMEGLDAVSIATHTSLHHPMAIAALDAGKHVICEKPFAMDQAQGYEMWQKAEATGLTAMVAHEFRFASGRMMVKELVDEGYIGQLHMALVNLVAGQPTGFQPRPYSPDRDVAENGGGFLFGLGSHYIDCLRHWFGEVEAAEGQVRTHFADRIDPATQNIVQATGDDTFHFSLQFTRGGWASMNATMAAPFGPGGRTEIYGREGTLVTPHRGLGVNPPSHGTVLGAKPGDEGLKELPIPERLQPFADERDDRLMPFRMFTREFVSGIDEGISPAPSFYDGFRCQQVLDAIRESSAIGRVVRIAP